MPRKRQAVKKTKEKRGKKTASAVSLPTPREQLVACLLQLIGWLASRGTQLHSALSHFQLEAGVVAWKDLEVCLRTLQAPVSPSDLAQLQPVLDPEYCGTVQLATLHSALAQYLTHISAAPAAEGSSGQEKCSCGLRLSHPPAEKRPNYVQLHMVLASFVHTPAHPGHAYLLLPDSTAVQCLQEVLQARLGGTAAALAVFRDASLAPGSRLAPGRRLGELGLAGGPQAHPTQAQLYYDYVPLVVNCPLLMADHYFPPVPP